MRPKPTVLLTRTAEDNASLSPFLQDVGFVVRSVPLLRHRAMPNAAAALLGGGRVGDVLVFTSRMTVDIVSAAHARRDLPCLAVGPETAARARDAGWKVAATSPDGTVSGLSQLTLPFAERLLYPHAAVPTAGSLTSLKRHGLPILEETVYRNEQPEDAEERLKEVWPVDFVPLFSSSAARRLRHLLASHALPTDETQFLCIGEKTLTALGLDAVVSPAPTRRSLMDTLVGLRT